MADVKISGLPASTTPLAGTEVLPIVQSSTTKQVSVANLTAGRAIAATSITTDTYKAASSSGGALQNSGGTPQLQWGAGGGNNLSVDVAININPANAAVAISPTGTGTVAISPAGALTVNPTAASTMNNVAIGGTTAAAGNFTTLGATGVTTVQAGTVSLPAITTTGDTNTGIFFPAADTIAFTEGGAEVMRIDSSSNVGIGTSSPSTKLAVAGSLGVTGQANFMTGVGSPSMTIGNTAAGDTGFLMSWLSTDSASVKNWQWTFNNYSAGMSLLSSTTSGSSAFVLADTLWNVKDAGQQTITDKPAANTSAFKFLSFVSNAAEAGSITRVAQTAAVTYNTTSDYRLKNNQAPLTGSGEFIDALKPKTWDWVSGGKATGFIAHEFAEVSPSSVTGEKDATQEEEYIDSLGVKATRTVPLYQGMQASSSEVIANLVAELQSLRKRVAALEAAQ
jgi:hypothetical protein